MGYIGVLYPTCPPFGGPASEHSPRPRSPTRERPRGDSVGIVATPHSPRIGRIPIREVAPRQPEDRWPAKSFVGEVVPFEATIFREGHGELFAEVLLTDPDGEETRHRMRLVGSGTDRWLAEVAITRTGIWSFRIRAAADDWASWLHTADIKIEAGQDVELVFAMGAELLERSSSAIFAQARAALLDRKLTPAARMKVAHDPRLASAIAAAPLLSLETTSETLPLRVERTAAGVGAWYEFFPRSEGAQKAKDGTW
jgi:starch synthase (maltosyl-transferring)